MDSAQLTLRLRELLEAFAEHGTVTGSDVHRWIVAAEAQLGRDEPQEWSDLVSGWYELSDAYATGRMDAEYLRQRVAQLLRPGTVQVRAYTTSTAGGPLNFLSTQRGAIDQARLTLSDAV